MDFLVPNRRKIVNSKQFCKIDEFFTKIYIYSLEQKKISKISQLKKKKQNTNVSNNFFD